MPKGECLRATVAPCALATAILLTIYCDLEDFSATRCRVGQRVLWMIEFPFAWARSVYHQELERMIQVQVAKEM